MHKLQRGFKKNRQITTMAIPPQNASWYVRKGVRRLGLHVNLGDVMFWKYPSIPISLSSTLLVLIRAFTPRPVSIDRIKLLLIRPRTLAVSKSSTFILTPEQSSLILAILANPSLYTVRPSAHIVPKPSFLCLQSGLLLP